MNGRVIPVIGSKPIVIDIFCICWYIISPINPIIIYLLILFLDFIDILINSISKSIIVIMSSRLPINPRLLAITLKIKSVCASGKYT